MPTHALVSTITLNSIANISTQLQTQLINIQGIARVVNFNQRFYYLACSLCNKASNAYQNEDLWCHYCTKKVAPLIRYQFFLPIKVYCLHKNSTHLIPHPNCSIKFNIQMEDSTGAIEAAVFPEIAETIYWNQRNITAPGVKISFLFLFKK